MTGWCMIIDVEKCENCNNCFLSCKDEFVGNDWPGYSVSQPLHGQRWIDILRKERGQFPLIDVAYLPVPCMHCDSAPCIRAAKDGAVYKRKDGIVIIDPERAKGQRDIPKSCPYGVIWWNEERSVPQKCTFCAHLLDEGWKEPRCVQACPTGALRVLKAEEEDMNRIVEEEGLEAFHPEYRTSPRVLYRNLYRYLRCFLAGSIAFEREGIVDCAEGAKVVLRKGGEKLGEATADNYGDFKIDRLEQDSGRYTIEITYKEYKKKIIEVEIKESINLGTILLQSV
ncbi:MAG: oxidoreductase [Deltaproteobacteria bacterium]|nr:oxidoreductase [Deltaproteobacteria bacterium]